MCLIKTPKITAPDPDAPENRPKIFRNPFLDGLGPQFAAQTAGRNSLRIGLGSGANARFLHRNSIPTIQTPIPTPVVPPLGPSSTGFSPASGGGGGGGPTGPGAGLQIY